MADDESPVEQNMRLAVALLDDEDSALEEILRLYGPAIFARLHAKYCKRLNLLRYEDIEDIVSIALKRLWGARKKYNDKKQSIRVWFYCIAVNVAKDVFKYGWYKARRLECYPGDEAIDEIPDSTTLDPSPEKSSKKRKTSKEATDLESILNKLSHEQRTIVKADAASRDGVASNELLADELGIPAAHVRIYRQRAYERIRNEMRKLGHNIPEPRKD